MGSAVRGVASKVRFRLSATMAARGSGRECTLCGWTGSTFLAGGVANKRRPDARCPSCRSLERHRLVHHLVRDQIPPGQLTLHVAPEPQVTSWLEGRSDEYVSIDLTPGRAAMTMSLTDLEFEDDRFSLVYCSHVLEHIPDDAAAISEMRRVLGPGGLAVVLVPTRDGPTDEDETVTTDEARIERFGQADHVRMYGLDLSDRLRAAGFEVDVLDVDDLEPDVVARYGLRYRTTRHVFLCR